MSFRTAIDQMRVAADRECTRLATRQREIDDSHAEVERLLAEARETREGAMRVKREADEALEEERAKMALHTIEDVVDLDVGGSHLRTYRTTLVRAGGLLEVMFSGRHEPTLTSIGHFIDFDPALFRRLLSHLRTGTLDVAMQNDGLLRTAANYFQIGGS